MKWPAVLFLCLIYIGSVYSQDSLVFYSGKYYLGELSYEDEHHVYFNKMVASNKVKLMRLPISTVFSINIKGNQPKYYYHKNSLGSQNFSIDQMSKYIKGEQDAIEHFNVGYHFLVGLGLGLSVSLLDTYEFNDVNCKGYFNGSASTVSIVIPFLTSVLIGFTNKKVRKAHVSDLELLNSPHYKRGFNYVKRYRKTLYSFLGSLTGVATIISATLIHQNNKPCP